MISNLLEPLWAALFPAECQICSKSLPATCRVLCRDCKPHLTEQAIPPHDALTQPSLPSVRQAWSAYHYQGQVRELLRRVKFHREFYLLDPLAEQARGLLRGITADETYDALIPIPTDWMRRLNRRFNQTEVLAQYWAKETGIRLDASLLKKRVSSHPQTGLSAENRKWNLYGSFKIRAHADIQEKSFLLIDDIVTTGATASEAARTLLANGARSVDLFTLARSDKRGL